MKLALSRIFSSVPPLPQAAQNFDQPEYPSVASIEEIDNEPQSIAGLLCVIEYADSSGHTSERLINCRRFDMRGDVGYVGAVSASGYGQFRTDRISAISDVTTGEVLGNGTYFLRYSATSIREAVASFGLSPSRKAHLIAGLNILAFMARCDGHWHPLEDEPIEQFVCSLWMRKEWGGEPVLSEILAHSKRIAPDGEVFFRSLTQYSRSTTSTRLIKQAVSGIIAADGHICDAEHNWATEMMSHLDELADIELDKIVGDPGDLEITISTKPQLAP